MKEVEIRGYKVKYYDDVKIREAVKNLQDTDKHSEKEIKEIFEDARRTGDETHSFHSYGYDDISVRITYGGSGEYRIRRID